MLRETPGEGSRIVAGRTAEESQRPGKAVLGRYVAGGGCGDSRAKSMLYGGPGPGSCRHAPLVAPTAEAIASDRMGKYAGQSLSAIQESQ